MKQEEIEVLKNLEKRIHDEYSRIFSESGEIPDFVMDGIIDYEKYPNEKIKILFLNREPNDEGASCWLRKDLNKQIKAKEPIFTNNHNIVPNLLGAFCVVQQLDNDAAKDMDEDKFCKLIDNYVNSNDHLGDFMLSTAYMNLKKIGGGQKTDNP